MTLISHLISGRKCPTRDVQSERLKRAVDGEKERHFFSDWTNQRDGIESAGFKWYLLIFEIGNDFPDHTCCINKAATVHSGTATVSGPLVFVAPCISC